MSKWRAILITNPPKSAKVLNESIRRNISKVVRGPKKDFEAFVAPNRPVNRPTILLKTSAMNNKIVAFTGVESHWTPGKKANAADKLMFVTRGTSVRYATMSQEFRPKTRRRVINTSGGSGRGTRDPVKVDTNDPQPGIEAREIEEAVAETRKVEVQRELYLVLTKGLKEANAI